MLEHTLGFVWPAVGRRRLGRSGGRPALIAMNTGDAAIMIAGMRSLGVLGFCRKEADVQAFVNAPCKLYEAG